MLTRCLFILTLLGLFACKSRNQNYVYSFYHWKTGNDRRPQDTAEVRLINEYGIEHFYLHFMDVDWSENLGIPVPLTQVYPRSLDLYATTAYTPVVFITNRTFERMSGDWCDSLADKITQKIRKTSGQLEEAYINNYIYRQLNVPYGPEFARIRDSVTATLRKQRQDWPRELQIDCDWTAGTKDKYFRFLARFKALNPDKTISATIRLYPYKYPEKTGVPPVDRGMLMCYNMDNITRETTGNSVFDLATLKQYIGEEKYPLQLDVALPLFGWFAWFRGNKFKGIVRDAAGDDISQFSVLEQELGNRYRLLRDTVIQDKYLREGDMLRKEFPDAQELLRARELLQDRIGDIGRIALYHWDYPTIKEHEEVIQKLFPAR